MERLVRHSQSINNYTTKNLIALNQYDKLGQLQNKKVGGTDLTGTNRWQKIDYSYNIRGWLTHINNPLELIAGENTTPPAPNDDLFAFQIRYNDPTGETQPLYNGNISQTTWKTASDNTQRGYNYTYDRLNRLRRADFYKQGAGNITAYGEFISYDLNGNITHLTRTTGDASDNDIDMDDLSYTYDKDGLSNLLVNVADAVTTGSTEGFKDGNTDPNLDDYEYDTNGNMIKDRNKGISNITYNHLNLPTQIEFEGTNNKITYLYNSVGQKLKKTVVYSDSIKIVDYLDGFQYTGEVLQFFPHAEGYVKATPTDILNTNYGYNYVFNYTDHLGNIRVSYSKDPRTNQLKILEENHYYPFGLKHSVYTGGRLRDFEVDFSNPEGEHVFLTPVTKTDYQYKYNGKEYQDELGLGLYDYGWRNYDPALGRWMNIDPLAEDYSSYTPYAYVLNNPVYFLDPDGMRVSNGDPEDTEPVNPDNPVQLETAVITVKKKKSSNPYDDPYVAANARGLYSAINNTPATRNIDKNIRDIYGLYNPLFAAINIWVDKREGREVGAMDYIGAIPPIKILKFTKYGTIVETGSSSLKMTLPGWKKISIDGKHIISGHTKGGSRVSSEKTLFPDNMTELQVLKTVRDAYKNVHSKLQTQGERILVRGSSNGIEVEMWINTATQTIETAYPIYK